MKLSRRWLIALMVGVLLIGTVVAAFAFGVSRTPIAAAASAQAGESCADDEAPGEAENEAAEANRAEDADCPGGEEDD